MRNCHYDLTVEERSLAGGVSELKTRSKMSDSRTSRYVQEWEIASQRLFGDIGGREMNWFIWALLSAFFAGLTAVLAKVGVEHVNSNLATAIRSVVILIFAWSVALFTKSQSISTIGRKTWIFLILSGIATGLSWLCYFRALQLGEA